MTSTPVPPSGRQCAIEAGPYAAVVVEVGAGLRTLHHRERALVDGYDLHEPVDAARGQMLVPWPNRIRDGRYSFGGRDHQLDLSEPAQHNAIHGLCRWVGWQVAAHRTDQVVLTHRLHAQPGYPFTLDLEVAYTVHAEDGLAVRMTATNVGADPAPYAAGAHPYLTTGQGLDRCTVHLRAETWLPTDAQGLPIGRRPVAGTAYDLRAPQSLAGLALDHAFTGLAREEDGRAWAALAGEDGSTTSLWVDSSFGYIQLYSGDGLPPSRRRTGLAAEPMTAPPNAFITGDDLRVLAPGESFTGGWGIVATR